MTGLGNRNKCVGYFTSATDFNLFHGWAQANKSHADYVYGESKQQQQQQQAVFQ